MNPGLAVPGLAVPGLAVPGLAVYVHWPYCARICPYCDFNVVRDRGQAEQAALAEAILGDLEAQAALIGPRRLDSLFFGGGTPSLMDPAWVAAVIDKARALWPSTQTPEISLEANPTDAEAGRFAALASAGVTRLSLDMIYARPDQTPQAWGQELTAALDLGPEHLSPYQLTIEPGTAFDRAVGRRRFTPPDPDQAAALYETTQAVLEAAGFEAYEVSNHALGAAARSRHNLAYWTGGDYVGAGPGAHGRLTHGGARHATRAEVKVGDYIAQVRQGGVGFAESEALSPRDAAIERLLLGLRIDPGVAWSELSALGLEPRTPIVEDLAAQGLARISAERLALTRGGRAVLDSVVRALVEAADAPA